jgi:protein involved in polysaccharide export with SLBB domain
MGQVVKPGYYPLPEKREDATVLKALASAGGKTPDGDIRNATLTRVVNGQSSVLPLNIEALLKGNAPDVPVTADDVLYIPQANNIINVLGKVTKPGAYNLNDNTTLVSLLGEAGGSLDEAALSKAYVMRGGSQMPVNLQSVVVDGTGDPSVINFKLQPGDVLVVPEVVARYAVMGQVRQPGTYHFRDNSSASIVDALSAAGGQLPDGNLSQAIIVRSKDGQTSVIPINLAAMMKQGKQGTDLQLRPGDVVFVPQKKNSKIQQFLGPLAILASAL